MNNRKRYRVKVQVYVLAADVGEAVDMVYSDLEYLTECDGGVIGFMHPTFDDVVEDQMGNTTIHPTEEDTEMNNQTELKRLWDARKAAWDAVAKAEWDRRNTAWNPVKDAAKYEALYAAEAALAAALAAAEAAWDAAAYGESEGADDDEDEYEHE